MTIFRGRFRAPGLAIVGAAAISLVSAGIAMGAVGTTSDSSIFATAVSDGVAPTGSSFAVSYACQPDDTTNPGGLCPTGIGNTPLAGFPTAGPTYGILTSGNAAYADDPNSEGGKGYDWGVTNGPIGPSVHDYQIARIDLPAATTSCLAFDFRFMSDEYPEYVNTSYNDAFIAQLNTWGVSADPATQTVNAPGNFAGGAGDVISVDGGGPSAMVDSTGLGVTYDGATPLLTARIPVTPGSTNTLFLTIFDQGDGILDSAAFVDNLRYEDIAPAKCKSLSLDPFDGTTGINMVAGNPPKLSGDLSKLIVPAECNLPPGPISCNVSASAAFTPTAGRSVVQDRTALLASTPLATGSANIAPSTVGKITMKTTKAGIKAVKAAIKKPAKLRATAKALIKKAKKLRALGQIAKAKKLEKKAAKLIKRAKALQKKPLGVVNITVTNGANGVSQTFKAFLKRP
jgi:hypothetical protein